MLAFTCSLCRISKVNWRGFKVWCALPRFVEPELVRQFVLGDAKVGRIFKVSGWRFLHLLLEVFVSRLCATVPLGQASEDIHLEWRKTLTIHESQNKHIVQTG